MEHFQQPIVYKFTHPSKTNNYEKVNHLTTLLLPLFHEPSLAFAVASVEAAVVDVRLVVRVIEGEPPYFGVAFESAQPQRLAVRVYLG